MHYSVAPLVEDRWGAECFCPPCHVYGQRGTGRSVPSAPPAMSVAGGVQDAQSHLPPPLPCLRPAGYGTFSPICPPAFLVSVCDGMYIPVINLWAGWAQDAQSHLPSLPCLRPAGYRTLCPVCLWAMLSSV